MAKKSNIMTIAEFKQEVDEGYEEKFHTNLCNWINDTYPGTIFTSESSGVRVAKWTAVNMAKCRTRGMKLPDLIILEPRGHYMGLILELKTIKASPFLKGCKELRDEKHVQAQARTLNLLHDKGYYATFGVGMENSKAIIQEYMKRGPYQPVQHG
jgi:hypothetical protein